jgi:diguanylate cyclase (GGDEF)-like protein
VLLLGATVVLQSAALREPVAAFAPVYAWTVFAVGLLLGWRFKRRQLVIGLLVLFAAQQALIYFTDAGPSSPGHTVFTAIALLLPLDLALLAWLTERSISSGAGQAVLVLILAQMLAVPLLARPELAHLTPLLEHTFVPLGGTWLLRVPQSALLAFAAAFGLALTRFMVSPTIIQSSLAWALVAAFLGLNRESPAPTVYLATAGLVLVVSLIETSHRMAFSDELTGLPSRRALTDALMRLPELYTVAMIDIDHFKKLNDEHGHAAGDQVLRLIGSTLTRTEGGGRPFRYGGEEFALLFPGKSVEEALPYIEELRETIEESTFIVRARNRPKLKPKPARSSGGRGRVAITVSIGVAEPDADSAEPEDVIRAADQALYRAKRGGRNRVVVAD